MRRQQNKHNSVVLWFTGFSGSGKSTLAHLVEEKLHQLDCRTVTIGSDNIRHGLCNDLDFSDESRKENIRRIGEVPILFIESGVIVLTAFISPYKQNRDNTRALFSNGDFIEIFVKCSISVCEDRVTKGMYQKARANKIKHFTGVSSPYEEPESPDLTINTDKEALNESVEKKLCFLIRRRVITIEN